MFVSHPDPHIQRRKEILSKHPNIASLVKANPLSAIWIFALVAAHISLAALMQDSSWFLVILVSYCVGAFIAHALWVFIHECCHGLVFKSQKMNVLLSYFCNLPLIVVAAETFNKYHPIHHENLGKLEYDSDLPSDWEAKFFGRNFLTKIVWLQFLPIFVFLRGPRLKKVPFFSLQWGVNFLIQIIFCWMMIQNGWKTFAYMALSTVFSLGFHPCGARWLSEHYGPDSKATQETYSYYGILNKLSFNIGYHSEHHDFPGVPWSSLPRVSRIAGEFYGERTSHRSWLKLLGSFLSAPDNFIKRRIVRS